MATSHPRLYDEFAPLWPLVSDPADYAEEAAHWMKAIRARLGAGRHRVLELGVGGGNNLSHLASEFDVVATDVSERMLEHSRKLNPQVDHRVGDMRSVRLRLTCDCVLIHDAIGYMATLGDLRAALRTAAFHLRPGGVLITAPDYIRETFTDPGVHTSTRRTPDGATQLTMFDYTWDPDPSDSQIECVFVLMIREAGNLRVEEDRHTIGLFDHATWFATLTDCGFDPERVDYPVHEARDGWLYIGIRRAATR